MTFEGLRVTRSRRIVAWHFERWCLFLYFFKDGPVINDNRHRYWVEVR